MDITVNADDLRLVLHALSPATLAESYAAAHRRLDSAVTTALNNTSRDGVRARIILPDGSCGWERDWRGMKIEAIKLHRSLTHLGLKESKAIVDALEDGGGSVIPQSLFDALSRWGISVERVPE